MNCPLENSHPETLVDYVAGALRAGMADALAAHLVECAACRSFVAEQAALWEALDSWETPQISPDFDRRLYRRVGERARETWWQRFQNSFREMPLRQVFPLVASACLLLIAGLLVQFPRPAVSRAPHPIVRASQVEKTLDDLDLLRQLGPSDPGESVHPDVM